EARIDVDPHRRVLLGEVVGQVGVGHQVEPEELHGVTSRGTVVPAMLCSAAASSPRARSKPSRSSKKAEVDSPTTIAYAASAAFSAESPGCRGVSAKLCASQAFTLRSKPALAACTPLPCPPIPNN